MAQSGARSNRPLSPHLGIYKSSITMMMSVAHRLTGIALYGGMFVLILWLLSVATGPGFYGFMDFMLTSWIGTLVVFAFTWALLHHAFGGIRHFIWDFGKGLEPETRMNMAWMTIIGSGISTLVFWLLAIILV